MADRLGARLEWIRPRSREEAPPRAETPRRPSGIEGFRPVGDHLFLREETLASPLAGLALPLVLPGLAPGEEASRLVFLDTETTGLSGGAGSTAFLVGIARADGERLVVKQLFLEDFPGELELVERLERELSERDVLVTFNGKAFDVPLLRTRFIMNGRRFPEARQLDLLYASRRLWKALIGPCSLRSIEERVLGIERSGDVPSFLVPEIYLDFLRTGDPSGLRTVFAHHRQDIVSLARLLAHMEGIAAAAARGSAPSGRFDREALGRLLVERGVESGVAFLERAASSGDSRAARTASLIHKRRGSYDRALAIWRELWERSESLFGGIELAKYYEHAARQPAEALKIVERLCLAPGRLASMGEEERAGLLARKARLERKTRRSD